jgi:hypothetical protein
MQRRIPDKTAWAVAPSITVVQIIEHLFDRLPQLNELCRD